MRALVTASLAVAALAALDAGRARAEPPTALRVVAEGPRCPTAAALAQALQHALPSLAVTTDATRPSPPARDLPASAGGAPVDDASPLLVEITDGGDRFSVAVEGRMRREFLDPARRCDERARAAAVFVALALEPPLVGLPDGAPPSPPPSPSPSPSPSPPPRAPAARDDERPPLAPPPSPLDDELPPPLPGRRPAMAPQPVVHIDLELAGAVAFAPGAPGTLPATGGGALRLYVGGAHLGVGLGVAAAAPAVVEAGDARARITRVPIDVSARGLLRRGVVEGALDLGLVAGPLVVEGNLPGAVPETRVDFALRAALQLRLWTFEKVAPTLGVEAAYSPLSYSLVISQVGPVGHTPQVWVAIALGLAARLR